LKVGPTGGEGEDVQEIQRMMQKVPNLHWQALLRDNRPSKPIILAVEVMPWPVERDGFCRAPTPSRCGTDAIFG